MTQPGKVSEIDKRREYILKITISHCDNIETAEISIVENSLNTKYAPNGTGRSTASKATEYSIQSPEKLEDLKPFKYLSQLR